MLRPHASYSRSRGGSRSRWRLGFLAMTAVRGRISRKPFGINRAATSPGHIHHNRDMEFRRSCGVLLHISSLPSSGGIGDLGPAAHDFVRFLAAAKQHVWQVLPLGPTGYGNSPYASSSAFAGNPSLISLELLRDWGWIPEDRLALLPGGSARIGFHEVEERKLPLLSEAARNFLERGPQQIPEQWRHFQEFCRRHAAWLDDYALYAELRRQFRTGAWTNWPEPLRKREPLAIADARRAYAPAIEQEKALQFAFSLQWNQLRGAAARNAIRIVGDVAIFVNMDSADVWVHPELFELDAELQPLRVAGVPPDYFSPTGQRWGNPLYRWDVLAARGFDWWIERIRRAIEIYDIVRLDHFRGFEAYWAIPAADETAVHGAWVKGPGLQLFRALEAALGPLPLIAEDLGLITPEVDAIREAMQMPGMKVMQFGFADAAAHDHLPHRYLPRLVTYTGTHDNDTSQGWWEKAGKTERSALQAYLGPVRGRPVWPMIRALEASVAALAIVPAQDLLELGSEARMNTPAVAQGNWCWRAPEGCWTPQLSQCLAQLTEITDRDNDPLAGARIETNPAQ